LTGWLLDTNVISELRKPKAERKVFGKEVVASAGLQKVTGGPICFRLERDCKEPLMNIEIHDSAVEARIQKQIQATGASSAEEALLRLLETQEEQDRWLLENKTAINAKIRRGIDQLDRGEGIPEDQLDAYLANLKAQPE
jgi:hypothetical protein